MIYEVKSLGKEYKPKTYRHIYLQKYLDNINKIKSETPDWERRVLPEPSEDEEHSLKYFIKIKSGSEEFIEEMYYVKHSKEYIISQLNNRAIIIHKWNNDCIEKARMKLDGWYGGLGLMIDIDNIIDILSYKVIHN